MKIEDRVSCPNAKHHNDECMPFFHKSESQTTKREGPFANVSGQHEFVQQGKIRLLVFDEIT
jgi:hypothetical protein